MLFIKKHLGFEEGLQMKTMCFICEGEVDTRKSRVYAAVRWYFKEALEMNDIKIDREIPRVVHVCFKCWKRSLKKKPNAENWYWPFSKKI